MHCFLQCTLAIHSSRAQTFDDHQRVRKDRTGGARRSLHRLKRTTLPSNPPKPALTAIQSPSTRHAAARRQQSCHD